tara:strand:+ start:239 stop:565 length:327 start_codon:yes stop_codon:yes gene_type:complete
MSEAQGGNPQSSLRGWKIALIGLLFSFNFWLFYLIDTLIGSFVHIPFPGIGWIMILVVIGTPIAFTGLILSIYDEWRAGRRNFETEIIVLAVLLGNTFFFATLGTIGV